MELSGNTVLITGASSGIGLALAKRFLEDGSRVIGVGRNPKKLEEAREAHSGLETMVCNIADPAQRVRLFETVTAKWPKINVLVNNAGMQKTINLLEADKDWQCYQEEIAINFEAPAHLSMLFAPYLVNQDNPAIINVSSGLALTPAAWVPIYTSTKSALHFFTSSLRLQLTETNIEVMEVLPPAVNTNLGGQGVHDYGVSVDEFADSVMRDLASGKEEIGYGSSKEALSDSYSASQVRKNARDMWKKIGSGITELRALFAAR